MAGVPMLKQRSPLSLEAREKMRLRRLRYFETHSPWNKGRKETRPEILEKFRVSHLGQKGNKGWHHSPKTLEVLRLQKLGHKRSPESIEKMKITTKQRFPNGILSDEAKDSIRRKLIGHSVSAETRLKIRNSKLGSKIHSEEHKRLLRERMKGNKYASVKTEEHRQKLIANRAKLVLPLHNTRPEKVVHDILDRLNVKYRTHVAFYLGNRHVHQVDVLIESGWITLEIDGCYWHQCPVCGHVKGRNGKSCEEIHLRDRFIEQQLKTLGYDVYRIWEHETKDLRGLEEKVKLIVDALPSLRLRLTE
jgi:DNA mismatch endonuclease (patch repair protein)